MFGKLGVWFWHLRKDAGMSGSLRTFRVLRTPRQAAAPPGEYPLTNIVVRFAGKRLPLRLRLGTFDVGLVKGILCGGSEYRVPVHIQPEVIFDAGANIGVTTLYFAALYPKARIYAFEPVPANLELLEHNIRPFADRITIVPKGLSDTVGHLEFHPSSNAPDFSAGGFRTWGDQSHTVRLPVTTVAAVCDEFAVKRIDLFKLDVEGSELDVLRATPPEVLASIEVLVGELHGIVDFEVIQLLSATHRVGYRKVYWTSSTSFVAVNRGGA